MSVLRLKKWASVSQSILLFKGYLPNRPDSCDEQETIKGSVYGSKGIRLDVFVLDDENTVYDLDVQTTVDHDLGKRTRYYQSLIDIRAIEKGQGYKHLKKSFVIFICNYDPYGKSRYIYTFRNRCDEERDILIDDDAIRIVINTKGTLGEISEELKAVIRYMDSSIVSDDYTKALDAEVESVKADEKVRLQYMLLLEAYARERNYGRYELLVGLIRRKLDVLSVEDMADMFNIPIEDCEKAIDAIKDHPDWDDEKIAEEIDWED